MSPALVAEAREFARAVFPDAREAAGSLDKIKAALSSHKAERFVPAVVMRDSCAACGDRETGHLTVVLLLEPESRAVIAAATPVCGSCADKIVAMLEPGRQAFARAAVVAARVIGGPGMNP